MGVSKIYIWLPQDKTEDNFFNNLTKVKTIYDIKKDVNMQDNELLRLQSLIYLSKNH